MSNEESARMEQAWAQRYRLSELAGRLEEQLDANAHAVFQDGTGTRVGALRSIANDQPKTDEFLANLHELLAHVKRWYGVQP